MRRRQDRRRADAGATVIVYPGDRVRDGVKVRPLP
jgi:hypothetical protein